MNWFTNKQISSLRVSLEPGERLIFQDGLETKHYPYPFTFAVTDRAVFVTKEKHFARESWYLERIPLSDIRRISLGRESISRILMISGLIFLFGLTLIIFMMLPYLNGEPEAQVKLMPFTLAILGLIMPFLVKERKILIIQTTNGTYKWKPKLIVNGKLDSWEFKFINNSENRGRIQILQENFLEACRNVGIQTQQGI